MMTTNKFEFALSLNLIVLTAALLVGVSQAQNSPTDFLSAHNNARANVSVGAMTWDATVAKYAQDYADLRKADCQLVHSTGGSYGENIAWSSSSNFTGVAAVNLWVAEKAFYSYPANTCQSGKVCGHYTQVVWRNSIRLGCGRVTCNNGGTFIICSYDPREFASMGRFSHMKLGSSVPRMSLLIVTMSLLIQTSQASPRPYDYLKGHNDARANVGVAPLVWNKTVAAYAREYASKRSADCNLIHSEGPYGENIAMGPGGGPFPVKYAVIMWLSEGRNYDYASNSCRGPGCGHYTQVVWRNSIHLGCAKVICDNGGTFIICSYDPPGNYIGERPY
ncbi:hypothetical protein MKW94_026939 [Papaver nudicaule]|uniref:SCP domain-containing protein n=1 Tax=Papaver nudicaule TaxID=74823 RepID=A0AA42B2R7_PAPNU|nr:hypothetical protein [Papaver nudicaule]